VPAAARFILPPGTPASVLEKSDEYYMHILIKRIRPILLRLFPIEIGIVTIGIGFLFVYPFFSNNGLIDRVGHLFKLCITDGNVIIGIFWLLSPFIFLNLIVEFLERKKYDKELLVFVRYAGTTLLAFWVLYCFHGSGQAAAIGRYTASSLSLAFAPLVAIMLLLGILLIALFIRFIIKKFDK
jgi:hypothetical protein